jgi:thiamine biosynthesis lipoprotein
MGSAASLAIPGSAGSANVHESIERVRAWLAEVEQRFSPFLADSEVCRAWTGTLRADEPSPLMLEVAAAVEHLEAMTDGAFHPADRRGRFDPTGYVKGWAIQRAVELLVHDGIEDACLGIGGDIQTIGRAGPDRTGADQPWRIAVVDPADARRIVAIVAAQGSGPLAVATSGNAQRGEHIWGPRSWQQALRETTIPEPRRELPPAQLRGSSCVTVVGPELRLADAYATAIWAGWLAGSLDQAWGWLGGTGYEALAVDGSGMLRATSGMADLVVRAAA